MSTTSTTFTDPELAYLAEKKLGRLATAPDRLTRRPGPPAGYPMSLIVTSVVARQLLSTSIRPPLLVTRMVLATTPHR
jgi:hypothetical protein